MLPAFATRSDEADRSARAFVPVLAVRRRSGIGELRGRADDIHGGRPRLPHRKREPAARELQPVLRRHLRPFRGGDRHLRAQHIGGKSHPRRLEALRDPQVFPGIGEPLARNLDELPGRDDVEDRGDDPVDRVLLPPVEVVTLRVRLHLRHPVSVVRLRGEERLLERKGADEVVARRRAVEVAHIGEIRREQHSLVQLEPERLRGNGRADEFFIEPDGREKVSTGRVRVVARGGRLFLRRLDKGVVRQCPGDRLGKIHRLHRRRGRREGKTERQEKQRRHGQGGNGRTSGGSGHPRLLGAGRNDLLHQMQQPRFPR